MVRQPEDIKETESIYSFDEDEIHYSIDIHDSSDHLMHGKAGSLEDPSDKSSNKVSNHLLAEGSFLPDVHPQVSTTAQLLVSLRRMLPGLLALDVF